MLPDIFLGETLAVSLFTECVYTLEWGDCKVERNDVPVSNEGVVF